MEEMIEITKTEYMRLLEAERFLSILMAAGVDNWEGYANAQEMQDEEGF